MKKIEACKMVAEIYFCTSNGNKSKEFESILKKSYPFLHDRLRILNADIDGTNVLLCFTFRASKFLFST